MKTLQPPLVVTESSTLRKLDELAPSAPPRDVIIAIKLELVEKELKRLCMAGKVFSVIGIQASSELKTFAAAFDAIPVFCAETIDSAIKLATDLRMSPLTVVYSALNGEAVGLKFLQGSPS